MIICVCGKSGSGKSTISKQLKSLYGDKIVHCDIDKVGHNIYSITEVLNELINSFGKDIIKNGAVDRKKLRNIVFNSVDEMNKLTVITWKYMEFEIDKIINDNKNKIIILDWLLLPNTKYFDMCNIKILLDIPYEIRKERAMRRDNISEDDFDIREKASIDYDLSKFDFVIDNKKNIIKRLVNNL